MIAGVARVNCPKGQRHHGDDDVERLRFIRQAKVAGFSLANIEDLTALDPSTDRARAQAMATARIADIDRSIAELGEARARLAKLGRSCARGEGDDCPIVAAFSGAEVT